jgi:1-acyl-sn-glycerol-3-phosphate acyltransferase
MIRGLLYWFVGCFVSLVWGIVIFILYPFMPRRHDFIHNNIRWWARFLLRVLCGATIEVHGLEKIDRNVHYIIVSNHRSYTDIMVGNASLPIQFRWLAKKSLFKIPLFGLAMRFAGYIPIVREHALSATRSLETSAEVLRASASVWIFPEGTRTPELKLRKFKRGAFQLALTTGLPILPVVMTGTDRIFEKPYKIRKQSIRVHVHEPLSSTDFKQENLSDREKMNKLMEAVRDTMQRSYDASVSRSS